MQPSAQQLRWWDQRALGDIRGAADRTVQNVSDLRAQPSRPGVDGGEGEAAGGTRQSGTVQRGHGREVLGGM